MSGRSRPISNAVASAPVADDQPTYPVLVLPIGLGGYRQMMSFQAKELASHGYIVAAIDQPYAAALVVFPDGYYVQVPGMFHVDMTDVPLVTPLESWTGLGGPIGVQRAHAIVILQPGPQMRRTLIRWSSFGVVL